MYSLRAQLAVLLLQAVSQIPYGEAGACTIDENGESVRIVTLPGSSTMYLCKIGPFKVCQGGCVATMQYDVHISDNNEPTDRCYTSVNQCTAHGETYKTVTTKECKNFLTLEAASQANGYDVTVREPETCSCDSYQTTTLTCDDYSKFIILQ